jgi:lysophospholipase L1-like esterase
MTSGRIRIAAHRCAAFARRRRSLLLPPVVGLVCLLAVEAALRFWAWDLYRPIEAELAATAAPGANEFTILCIGDSHTYGIGAPGPLSYPRQLANLLNGASKKTVYRVINAGVPGTNSSEALAALRKVYARNRRVDLVLVLTGGNNSVSFRNASFFPDDSWRAKPAGRQIGWLIDNSKLLRLGKFSVLNLRLKRALTKDPHGTLNILDNDFLRRWLFQDYDAMVQAAREHGSAIVFLTYHAPWNSVNRFVAAYAKERGVRSVELLWLGLSPDVVLLHLVGESGHLNQYGYSAMVRIVRDYLVENGVVPE